MVKEYIVKITNDVQHDVFERFEHDWSPDELVRCKDCKNCHIYGNGYNSYCQLGHNISYIDGFCSEAERT